LKSSVEGPGCIRAITGTDPAAGSEICETVPTNARWRLLGIRFSLTTSSAVADRLVQLVIDDGTTPILWGDFFPDVQTAGNIWTYQASLGGVEHGNRSGIQRLALVNDLILPQGWRIRTSTANLQIDDDFAAPELIVEEWIEE